MYKCTHVIDAGIWTCTSVQLLRMHLSWGVLVADEEDVAIPNEGYLVPFLALLMIYEFFFPAPPPTNTWVGKMQRDDQGHQTMY